MRILLLNQYYAPDEAATAQLLADVGDELVRRGHDVVAVCSSAPYSGGEPRRSPHERVGDVDVRRVRTTRFGRATKVGRLLDYATFLAGAALRLLQGPRPAVIVALSTPPLVALLGLGAARLRKARLVYWVMDVYPDLAFALGAIRQTSIAARVLASMSSTLLRRADRVIALDTAMADRLRVRGGRAVIVSPNWADGRAIHPRSPRSHPLRREWGWEGRFVVVYSGNMGLAHEFETVIETAIRLRSDPSILFSFIGNGPRRLEIERAVGEHRLPNVELRPPVPRARLGESLSAGDVHLVTLRNGMPGLLVPSKIYGILAAGRPTIYVGPEEGEVAEIVSQGCGVRIKVGDAEALERAIRAYRDDPESGRIQGNRGRELFETRYDRPLAVDPIVRLIEEREETARE